MDTRKSYSLVATPGVKRLAERLLECASAELELRSIDVRLDTFPDGTPDVNIPSPADNVCGRDVVLLCDYDLQNKGANWLGTLALIYSLPRYRARSLVVVMPFFPVGTMERVSAEGDVATAATFARMLSCTPLTCTGPVRFMFFDIHALQERFYFGDMVLPTLVTAIPLVKRELAALRKAGERVVVAFPDDGAKKRFGPEFAADDTPLVVCSKVREGGKRFLKITEGAEDVSGSHVVVIDDLVQTGGTMINCKDLLMDTGAAAVSGYVTHGVFPNAAWRRFLTAAPTTTKPFRHFWITDSVSHTAEAVAGQQPFSVLSLAPEIAGNLVREPV